MSQRTRAPLVPGPVGLARRGSATSPNSTRGQAPGGGVSRAPRDPDAAAGDAARALEARDAAQPSDVIALQRAAGNRAVTAWVQREAVTTGADPEAAAPTAPEIQTARRLLDEWNANHPADSWATVTDTPDHTLVRLAQAIREGALGILAEQAAAEATDQGRLEAVRQLAALVGRFRG